MLIRMTRLLYLASDAGVHPSDLYHFTSPEEASELVREQAAWRSFHGPQHGGSLAMGLLCALYWKIVFVSSRASLYVWTASRGL